MSAEGSYIAVRGTFRSVHDRGIWLAVGDSTKFVPRSLIRPDDATMIDGLVLRETVTLHIVDWKVRELGWESGRDEVGASRDLFSTEAPKT